MASKEIVEKSVVEKEEGECSTDEETETDIQAATQTNSDSLLSSQNAAVDKVNF
jgi:hypothetical protein